MVVLISSNRKSRQPSLPIRRCLSQARRLITGDQPTPPRWCSASKARRNLASLPYIRPSSLLPNRCRLRQTFRSSQSTHSDRKSKNLRIQLRPFNSTIQLIFRSNYNFKCKKDRTPNQRTPCSSYTRSRPNSRISLPRPQSISLTTITRFFRTTSNRSKH
jgi:hypothetical protein